MKKWHHNRASRAPAEAAGRRAGAERFRHRAQLCKAPYRRTVASLRNTKASGAGVQAVKVRAKR